MSTDEPTVTIPARLVTDDILQSLYLMAVADAERWREFVSAVKTSLSETKPPEPEGIGAVAKDGGNDVWIAVGACVSNGELKRLWAPVKNASTTARWRTYDQIDVVEVLSPGWVNDVSAVPEPLVSEPPIGSRVRDYYEVIWDRTKDGWSNGRMVTPWPSLTILHGPIYLVSTPVTVQPPIGSRVRDANGDVWWRESRDWWVRNESTGVNYVRWAGLIKKGPRGGR